VANPKLPACEVHALFQRAGGQILEESQNDARAICR